MRREMHKELWWRHLKKRDRRRHRWEDNIKLYLNLLKPTVYVMHQQV